MVSQISSPITPANQVCKKITKEDIRKIPDKIEETGDTINDSLDKINDTMKRTTESVGAIAITGTGLIATLRKPFDAIINWLKEAKIDPKTGEVLKDEFGKIIKGNKFSKNKLIGVAIAAAVATAIIVAKTISKNKAKKAEQAQLAQQTQQTEPKEAEHKLDVAVA